MNWRWLWHGPGREGDLPLHAHPQPERRKVEEENRPGPLGWIWDPLPRRSHYDFEKYPSREEQLHHELDEIGWFCELLGRPFHAVRDWHRGRRLGRPK